MHLFHKQFDVSTTICYAEIISCVDRGIKSMPHKIQPPQNISLEFVIGFYRKQCQQTVEDENERKL
jgi:hypothetical protein